MSYIKKYTFEAQSSNVRHFLPKPTLPLTFKTHNNESIFPAVARPSLTVVWFRFLISSNVIKKSTFQQSSNLTLTFAQLWYKTSTTIKQRYSLVTELVPKVVPLLINNRRTMLTTLTNLFTQFLFPIISTSVNWNQLSENHLLAKASYQTKTLPPMKIFLNLPIKVVINYLEFNIHEIL